MLHDSWFNSTPSTLFAWGGSTVLTFISYLQQPTAAMNPLPIIGWLIITIYGIISSISKIKVNNSKAEEHLAEARKLNAEAAKIEVENGKCNGEGCSYKDFYDEQHKIKKY